MSSLEWTVVYAVAGVGVVGVVLLLIGRVARWRSEASREPLRTPSRITEYVVGDTPQLRPAGSASGEGQGGKGTARPELRWAASAGEPRLGEPGPAPGRTSPTGLVAQGGESIRLVEAARTVRSSPNDLLSAGLPGAAAGPARSALDVAEAELELQESQLGEAQARFARWSAAAGDALLESLNEHDVDSEEELPAEAVEQLQRQKSALNRLAGELDLMERSVKRKTAALDELRRVLQRSTESGWGRRPGA